MISKLRNQTNDPYHGKYRNILIKTLIPCWDDVDCCWRPLWFVNILHPVPCPIVTVYLSLYPDCSGVAPSALVSDYFHFYFPCSLCFLIISCIYSKISEYSILLSPVKTTLDYVCLLIVLLSTAMMTSDNGFHLIFICNIFWYYQCIKHSLIRLVTYTPILVPSHHTQCCAFSWRVHIISSVYAVNIYLLISEKRCIINEVLKIKFKDLQRWTHHNILDLILDYPAKNQD